MGSFGIWHWIVVVVVVLLLFGRGKISELMGDVAQGIKAFKKGMADDDKADVEKAKDGPTKIIDHAPADTTNAGSEQKARAETERKFEGGTL
jgi:sec-independent protein translocase protein TatA